VLTPEYTTRFRRDYKRVIRRNYDVALLKKVMDDLMNEVPLDKSYKDHVMFGEYKGCRECHIKPDWLLIYQIGNGLIAFERTGTHSELLRR
jgi:mRNA interferase YafQ